MPAILIGAAVVSLGSALWGNKKRKDAAEDAQEAMAAEERARQEQINQALSDLDALASGEINIPIDKPEVAPMTEVEKGKIGDNYFDALDTAKSDAAINEQIKQSEKALSAQLDIQDPRIKAAVAAKAVDKFNDEQAEIQAQGKEEMMRAQMAVGKAQTENEMDFVRRQQQAEEAYNQRLQSAENMYSQQVNQYMQNEYNRLQDIIGEQTEEQYGLQYGQATVVGQAQAQNAADFSGAVNDTIGMALPYSGVEGFEEGGKIPNAAEEGKRVKSRDRNEALLRWMASLTPDGIDALAAAANRTEKKDEKPDDTTDSTNKVVAENYTAPTGGSGLGAKSFEDSRIDNLILEARTGGKFSLEQGGAAAMTRGEFNHGDIDRPETGNDQVLIDQEDLKSGLDSGAIKSYEDIENNDMVQAVTTGGELIFNDEDSGNIEKLTMDTDPLDTMGYARKGKKLMKGKKGKGKKRSKAEIRKAEAALAAYMRNLLSQDQFQA